MGTATKPMTRGPMVADFFETFCTLNKEYAGQPFVPMPWVRDLLDDIYKVNPATGRRQYTEYLLGIPRKNAKSTICAGLAIFHLVIADEGAPEIVIAAGDTIQARIVFEMARDMVTANPDLSKMCKTFRSTIECPSNGGVIRVVSADAKLKHGLNPSVVIIDEYHVHPNTDLYVALTSGFGMRSEPLTIIITTAGSDMDSPLGVMFQKAMRIETGEETDPDPTFGFTWYGPRPGEKFDPTDEEFWQIVNPSWDAMNQDEMRSAMLKLPEADGIRFRLNGWTATKNSWFRIGTWEKCHKPDVRPIEPGDDIVLGFDGSVNGDCTGIVACRIDDLHIQKMAAWERPLDAQEWRVPVSKVMATLRELNATYNPRLIGFDPYLWKKEAEDLDLGVIDDDGNVIHEPLPMEEVNTAARAFFADTKLFYDAVLDQELSHNGDPQLARHVANTQYKPDQYGNNRITKEHKSSTKYIDLTVCATIALGLAATVREEEPQREAQMIVI